MRSFDEIAASATAGSAFSNGTEFYDWQANWCDRCREPTEVAWRRYEEGQRKTAPKQRGCPLLLCAMLGEKTPIEWIEQPWGEHGPSLQDRYHCIEFKGPDGGGREPRPKPDPPNMDGLFPRPEPSRRMLKQSDMERLIDAES